MKPLLYCIVLRLSLGAKLNEKLNIADINKIKSDKSNEKELENIIKLSVKKQCSCCIILSKAVEITYSLEIY